MRRRGRAYWGKMRYPCPAQAAGKVTVMCGIAGVFNRNRELEAPAAAVLVAMAGAIAHRGPDDQGVECGSYWGLANRRLAIIGVSSGHQPLSNEDGSAWVSFNGEIYNHHELRRQLR